ncbi:beta-agarase [Aquimarina sp. RZ0]|uniref:beta-agarase n=1 Tax=Aquimarina sp. RZ0 TaxID=2607730 RepID=UPI0011F33FDA|nr:beta-agarase [Aquimarina sp. RZ0]KAA1245549.1 beta-agarase [Aquimarina sp. RZ0]
MQTTLSKIIKRSSFILFFIFCSCQKSQNTQNSTIAQNSAKSQNIEDTHESLLLFDFEKDLKEEAIKTINADYEIIRNGNSKKLKVQTNTHIKTPGIKLYRTKDNLWDLNNFYQVKADVSNLSKEDLQIEMFVGNDPDGLIRWYCSDYVDLKPGQTKTITVNLSWTPWVFSPQPEVVGMRGVPGIIKTDLDAIAELQFNTRYATSQSTFAIDNIIAKGKTPVKDPNGFFPFVDAYGQYKHKKWKNKILDDKDLKQKDSIEIIELQENASPPNRNQYGGWTKGPQLKATGFFRTEKNNGKWWMVDPEGYLFWTAGLNCVSSQSATTGIEHREHYFEKLPDTSHKNFKTFYNKNTWSTHGFYKDKIPYKTYNFYQSNLFRKYGDNWLETFRDRVHKRFRSWGINTIGFVSDDGAILQKKTPYTGSIWITGTPKIEGSGGFWGKFHDVFDPNFRAMVRDAVERQRTGAGDPWCIGFFVDNELSWGTIGSLSIGALKSPATQPAKINFINELKDKYTSIEALNTVWKTTHTSWEQLLKTTVPPNKDAAKEDLTAFYQKIADSYFRIINEELKRIAPHQNYLGCRFAWANNDITLKAAAKYCDIMSFNKYENSVKDVTLPQGVDKPIMISEFHFGATDRGMAHPGVKASKNQQERALSYQNFVTGALENKLIVGAHWFQYIDEAFTGRGDGENYNIGFIDVGDTPYKELIDKVRQTLYPMYEYRNKQ